MATEYNYEHALRCLSDAFTPVRDLDGALLGAIPKVTDDNAVTVSGTNGQNFELRIALQVCVCVDVRTQNPSVLPDFLPLDLKNADIGTPIPGTEGADPGADPDLAQPL